MENFAKIVNQLSAFFLGQFHFFRSLFYFYYGLCGFFALFFNFVSLLWLLLNYWLFLLFFLFCLWFLYFLFYFFNRLIMFYLLVFLVKVKLNQFRNRFNALINSPIILKDLISIKLGSLVSKIRIIILNSIKINLIDLYLLSRLPFLKSLFSGIELNKQIKSSSLKCRILYCFGNRYNTWNSLFQFLTLSIYPFLKRNMIVEF